VRLASHAFKKLALHYTNKKAIILHEIKDLNNSTRIKLELEIECKN